MADQVGGTIVWNLSLEVDKFNSELKNVQDSVNNLENVANKAQDKMAKQAEKASKVIATAFGVMAVAAVAFGRSSVAEYNKHNQVVTQLTTLLLNSKGATMEHVEALKEQAKAMQKVTPFAEDLVLQAQKSLATFDLSAKAIHEIIPAFLDMAAAEKGVALSFEDMHTLAEGFGKAMVGQTEALVKQGFQFTELQHQILKTGTEQQRLAVMTEALGERYGGMAKILLDQNPWITTRNNMDDFQQGVGEMIKNGIDPLIKSFNDWVESVGGVEAILIRLKNVLSALQPYFPLIAGAIAGAFVASLVVAGAALGVTTAAVVTAIATFGLWIAAGAGVAAIAVLIATTFGDLKDFIIENGQAWVDLANKIGDFIGLVVGSVSGFITWIVSSIAGMAKKVLDWFLGMFNTTTAAAAEWPGKLAQALSNVAQQLAAPFMPFFKWIGDKFSALGNKLKEWTQGAFGDTFGKLFGTMSEGVKTLAEGFGGLSEKLSGGLPALGSYVKGLMQVPEAIKKSLDVGSYGPNVLSGQGDSEGAKKAANEAKKQAKEMQDMTDKVVEFRTKEIEMANKRVESLKKEKVELADLKREYDKTVAGIIKNLADLDKSFNKGESSAQASFLSSLASAADTAKQTIEDRKSQIQSEMNKGDSADQSIIGQLQSLNARDQAILDANSEQIAKAQQIEADKKTALGVQQVISQYNQERAERLTQYQQDKADLRTQLADKEAEYQKSQLKIKTDTIVSITDIKTGYLKMFDDLHQQLERLGKDFLNLLKLGAISAPGASKEAEAAYASLIKNAPKRAMGGPVMPNRAYMVGERGPELFMPSQGGNIIPNGGGNTLHIENINLASDMDVDNFIDKVTKKLGIKGLYAEYGASNI